MLELSAIKAVEVDANGRTAWAQAGITAGEYTKATGEHGLATGLGTRRPSAWRAHTRRRHRLLGPKHGLTIDDALTAEVVTADGALLEADEQTHADLFWAVRGGGGNFGVATRLRFRLHELDEVVGGMLMLPASADVITGLVAVAEAARGTFRDREHPEGSADAVHPRRATRQAGGDRLDGLRRGCRRR